MLRYNQYYDTPQFLILRGKNETAYALLPPHAILQSVTGAVTAPSTSSSPQTGKVCVYLEVMA